MYRSGLVDTLVTHANTKGFGLTSLSGVRHDFMLPQLKTKQIFIASATPASHLPKRTHAFHEFFSAQEAIYKFLAS